VAISDEEPGWIYLCEDGTYARQVIVQKLRNGKIRLFCKNTGGQSQKVADRLLKESQALIEKHGLDGVYVEQAED